MQRSLVLHKQKTMVTFCQQRTVATSRLKTWALQVPTLQLHTLNSAARKLTSHQRPA